MEILQVPTVPSYNKYLVILKCLLSVLILFALDSVGDKTLTYRSGSNLSLEKVTRKLNDTLEPIHP